MDVHYLVRVFVESLAVGGTMQSRKMPATASSPSSFHISHQPAMDSQSNDQFGEYLQAFRAVKHWKRNKRKCWSHNRKRPTNEIAWKINFYHSFALLFAPLNCLRHLFVHHCRCKVYSFRKSESLTYSTLRFVSFWLASLFWNVFCRISS